MGLDLAIFGYFLKESCFSIFGWILFRESYEILHSLNRYLFSAYFLPDIVLRYKDPELKKKRKKIQVYSSLGEFLNLGITDFLTG